MPRKKRKSTLPQYVVIKFGDWYVRRTFPTNETYPNGTKKRLEITRRCIPETEERAIELAAQIESHLFAGKEDQAAAETVESYIAKYLEIKHKTVTRRTHQGYAYLSERYVHGSLLGRTDITAVTSRDIQIFISGLEKAGTSATMIRKVFVLLSMVFRQAVIWEDLDKNPTIGTMLPKAKSNESVALNKAETKRLIEVFRKDKECLIFELDLETGLRPQEVVVLTWADIDLERCRVRVNKALSDGLKGGGFEIKEPKTKSSIRSVSFSPYMRDRLIEHKKQYQEYLNNLNTQIAKPISLSTKETGFNYQKRKAFRRNRREVLANHLEYDLVFPSATGLPKSGHNLNCRKFKESLKAAGIDATKFSFKSLRHTHASIMAEKVSPRRLQKHLGHSTVLVTLQYYVHVDDDSQEDFNATWNEEIYDE